MVPPQPLMAPLQPLMVPAQPLIALCVQAELCEHLLNSFNLEGTEANAAIVGPDGVVDGDELEETVLLDDSQLVDHASNELDVPNGTPLDAPPPVKPVFAWGM